jgi:hypothetical protein
MKTKEFEKHFFLNKGLKNCNFSTANKQKETFPHKVAQQGRPLNRRDVVLKGTII